MRSFMRREFWHRSIHISPKWYTLAVVILCITSAFLYKSTQLQAHMIRNAQGSARSAADEVVYLSNVHITKLITLGHNHAAADLLWIRT